MLTGTARYRFVCPHQSALITSQFSELNSINTYKTTVANYLYVIELRVQRMSLNISFSFQLVSWQMVTYLNPLVTQSADRRLNVCMWWNFPT